MNATPSHTETDPAKEIRRCILAAATQRFTQFGYNKTTMAEIAEDCDMSAANLYRFFKNKLDIGANLACGCLDTKLMLIEETVQQHQRPAADRLRDVVMQTLEYTHGQWADNPRMNEMVNAICDARLDIVDNHKQSEHHLLVDLLEDGIQSGEFDVTDVHDTASAIATAITAFSMPLMMPLCSIDEFEQRAESVIRLMLNGLKSRT